MSQQTRKGKYLLKGFSFLFTLLFLFQGTYSRIMGRRCKYVGCFHTGTNDCSLHKIPCDKPTARRWLRRCGLNGTPSKLNVYAYVCSHHFVDGRPTVANPDPIPYCPGVEVLCPVTSTPQTQVVDDTSLIRHSPQTSSSSPMKRKDLKRVIRPNVWAVRGATVKKKLKSDYEETMLMYLQCSGNTSDMAQPFEESLVESQSFLDNFADLAKPLDVVFAESEMTSHDITQDISLTLPKDSFKPVSSRVTAVPQPSDSGLVESQSFLDNFADLAKPLDDVSAEFDMTSHDITQDISFTLPKDSFKPVSSRVTAVPQPSNSGLVESQSFLVNFADLAKPLDDVSAEFDMTSHDITQDISLTLPKDSSKPVSSRVTAVPQSSDSGIHSESYVSSDTSGLCHQVRSNAYILRWYINIT
ncbi:IPT/TIG domain-containing protein [Frankliniella fusca]|uniref:IPT/TIG domain-containing protein n=1 Tax=Frankliniella fusca TaxID=407009 RepID=A0AAE1I230_9NEOP|nr:IPT/TIG domain-containing protein [Frankliniella fusca]